MQALLSGTHISSVLTSLENPQLIASNTLLSPKDFNGTVHYHDNAHFSFVLKGGCAEKKKVHYERLPGSITFYEAGEIHQITKVNAPSYHVNFELPTAFFSSNQIHPENIAKALSTNPQSRIMMLNVQRELELADANSISSLQLTLLELVQQSLKLHSPSTPKWALTIKELLADRWQEKITLEELSTASGMHPVTISKYFSAYFGCTFGEYLRKQKIHRAIALIKQPEKDLSTIAHACGFADQSHFIRTFKSLTGMLPTKFRKS